MCKQMNVIVFRRRHTHECYQSIENVKINVDKQLMSEIIESKEINVYSHLLNECWASNVGDKVGFKHNVDALAQIGVRLHQPELH